MASMADTIETLEQAARHAPGDPAPAFRLCVAYLNAANEKAGPLLADLLTRFPGAAEGWDALAQAFLDAGKREAALVCAGRALQGGPTAGRAIRAGMIGRDLGRIGEARMAFQRAVELAPGSARAWFGLGLCDQDLGDRAAAARAYRAAVARDGRLAEAEVNLGIVLQEGGDLVGAKAAYGRAVAIRPDTVGRIAQAIAAAPRGELWLDLGGFRRSLGA